MAVWVLGYVAAEGGRVRVLASWAALLAAALPALHLVSQSGKVPKIIGTSVPVT